MNVLVLPWCTFNVLIVDSRFLWIVTFDGKSKCLMNFVNNSWTNVLAFLGIDGGLLLSAGEPPPKCIVNFVFFSWLLSQVFRSIIIKAVQKLCVCILLSANTSPEVLICSSWQDNGLQHEPPPPLLQHCSLALQTTLWVQCMNRNPWTTAVTPWDKKPECPSC